MTTSSPPPLTGLADNATLPLIYRDPTCVLTWPELSVPDLPSLPDVTQVLLSCVAPAQAPTQPTAKPRGARKRRPMMTPNKTPANELAEEIQDPAHATDLRFRATVLTDPLVLPRMDGLGIPADQCSSTKLSMPIIVPSSDLQPSNIAGKVALIADAIGALIPSVPDSFNPSQPRPKHTKTAHHHKHHHHHHKHHVGSSSSEGVTKQPKLDAPAFRTRLTKIHETLLALVDIVNLRIDDDLEALSAVVRNPELGGAATFFVSPGRRGDIDRIGLVGQPARQKKPPSQSRSQPK